MNDNNNHIKRFNESSEWSIMDNNNLPFRRIDLIKDKDFENIKKTGRSVYYVDNDFNVVESHNLSNLKKAIYNKDFPFIIMIDPKFIPTVEKLLKSIYDLKIMQYKEISLRFDQARGIIQDYGDPGDTRGRNIIK